MRKYIFTHDSDYKGPEGYEVIYNHESDLDHRLWSELAGYKILFDRINSETAENGMLEFADGDWISLNHYRRLIDPDIYDRTAVAAPMALPVPLFRQYEACHRLDDLKLSGEALKAKYPHMVQAYEQALNGNILIPYTIGVMTVGQFKDYFTFLKTVLTEVLQRTGFCTYEEVLEFVKKTETYRGDGKDERPEYQARILSFLAERLATAYWLFVSRQSPVFPAKIILTEPNQKI